MRNSICISILKTDARDCDGKDHTKIERKTTKALAELRTYIYNILSGSSIPQS